MTKRTVTILSVAAIAFLVAAFVGFGPAFATHLRSCQSSLYGPNAGECLTSASGPVLIGFVLYLAGVLAAVLAWLVGLVQTGRLGRWGWFLLVLLLSPLGSLLYGLAGPTTKASA
jgi:hypothetical protein